VNTDGNCIERMVPCGLKNYLYVIPMVKHTVSLQGKDTDLMESERIHRGLVAGSFQYNFVSISCKLFGHLFSIRGRKLWN
jgi:hypothetical protein